MGKKIVDRRAREQALFKDLGIGEFFYDSVYGLSVRIAKMHPAEYNMVAVDMNIGAGRLAIRPPSTQVERVDVSIEVLRWGTLSGFSEGRRRS